MISASDRRKAVTLIEQAVTDGARKRQASEEMGISLRTLQRWTQRGEINVDARPESKRPEPAHKLTAQERAEILQVVNDPKYRSLPPSQIVPALADEQRYLASESSFYRVLRQENQQHPRGRSQAAKRTSRPTTHTATAPNQVWCWDITWLPGPAKGVFFYLYLVLDLYSRKVVGWEVHEKESAEQAGGLMKKAHLRERIGTQPLVLHSDNGSPMKGASLLETLYGLGVVNSYSRPRVSNDNAYAESIFRTCKYRPDYPYKGFSRIEQARQWVLQFVHWYNHEHKHSGIKFVTPAQRHTGDAQRVVEQRHHVYEAAKSRNPRRWSGKTRDWTLPSEVHLNPEKERVVLKKVS